MRRTCLLALIAITAPRLALADKAAAIAAYDRAKQLVKDGKYAEACPLFELSYQADPGVGVLLNLADCHENIGRTASAWIEFRDAAELARNRNEPAKETYARSRADSLAPRLVKLRLTAPPTSIPGLVVRRDGSDVTVLIGTDMPVDPGDHQISASAPDYVDAKLKVTVAANDGTKTVAIPALVKAPDKPVEVAKPSVHEATLEITAPPDAQILLDSDPVGTGHYVHKMKSGGHTLRVTAPGMRPYQNEVMLLDDDTRKIDIILEKEPTAVVIVPPAAPVESGPTYELGLSFAPGQKGHGDRPAVIAYRLELALRLGRRVNLGAFVEYASISASGSCGTDIAGPTPATPFDFGARTQFGDCRYVMPGLQLYVHILPNRQLDPYVGIAPGFRFGLLDYTPYMSGTPTGSQSKMFPGIAVALRAGVDYHPTPEFRAWEVGAFFDTQIMVKADENFDNTNDKGKTYVSLFGGLRSTVQF